MRFGILGPSLAGGALALALTISGFLASEHLAGRASLLDRAEGLLLDLRFGFVGPTPRPDGVAVIAIDDDTIREAGSYPLRRSVLADLVRKLSRLGVSAIGLDILLLDPGQPDDDAELARALRESGAVIASAGLFARETWGEPGAIPSPYRVLMPRDVFSQVAGNGLVNVGNDQSGTARHAPLLFRTPDGIMPSFPLRLAAKGLRADPAFDLVGVTIGPVRSALDLGSHLPFRFYGPGGTVPTISAARLLRGEGLAAEVRDRIVVIGATGVGTADTFSTPFDPVLPGVEVLATAVAHLVRGDDLIRDERVRRFDAAAAITLAAGTAVLPMLTSPGIGLLVTLLAGVAWLAVSVVAFAQGYWISGVLPLAAMAPGALAAVLGRQIVDRMRTRRLVGAEQALRAFHSPAMAKRLAMDPGYLLEPVVQLASVLFVDLSGFTQLSETLGPTATREFLKSFHSLIGEAAARHGGLVISYMGDGAMLVFGLLDPAPDDPVHALEAAAAIVPRITGWMATLHGEARELDVRVGAHHGEVVVSRLGTSDHQHITATGDSVNVASRLLEVCKQLATPLVVSEELIRAAGRPSWFLEAFEGRRTMPIRGRQMPLAVAYRAPTRSI